MSNPETARLMAAAYHGFRDEAKRGRSSDAGKLKDALERRLMREGKIGPES